MIASALRYPRTSAIHGLPPLCDKKSPAPIESRGRSRTYRTCFSAGGQRWLEGPIQRKVESAEEYKKPIDLQDVQDAINDGLKGLRKEDPTLAAGVTDACVKNVVMVMKEDGKFSLEGLERQNDNLNLAQSGIGKLASSAARDKGFQDHLKLTQLGTAVLVNALVGWVNGGRPELAQDQKMPLDIGKIRQAVKDEGMKPEDQQYVGKLLDAFQAKLGDTISMRQLDSFHDEIGAAKDTLQEKNDARKAAGLAPNEATADAEHAYVTQSLGAYRLSEFLTFSADQGELGNLAANVKPGAAEALAGAAD